VRVSTIAAAILRDRNAPDPAPTVDLNRCILCARTFTQGRGFGLNGRFCSRLCLEAYDTGYVHRDAGARYTCHARGDGFVVDCRQCRRPFVSKGLRCCSDACERRLKERADIAETMASVEMETTGYTYRKCAQCNGAIPRYTGTGRKRRETRQDARFCSRRCSDKARRPSMTMADKAIIARKHASEMPVD
jgi:hypothetical protein